MPLHTNVIFSSGSDHQVIAPNKVVELRKSSVVLEKPFEGSTEIPFYVCRLKNFQLSSFSHPHVEMCHRNRSSAADADAAGS